VSVGVMFMIDVQIAMVGYILTMKPLDAHIRTANPLLAGWLAALICYPPFQQMEAGRPLFYQQNSASWGYWLAGHPGLLWGWAALLVLLTGIYAWATVAFGLRFSNLTHRGVLTNGPYALSRHPAYLAKNLFWWLETLPFLVTSHSLVEAIRNSFFLGCVSAIYFWRAKTEEAHLLSVDAKYRDYHAWMARNGPVTKVLSALSPARRTAEPVLHPAE
jgi:protein-S-isoprenylcysteine O-methyltransferase Ste14